MTKFVQTKQPFLKFIVYLQIIGIKYHLGMVSGDLVKKTSIFTQEEEKGLTMAEKLCNFASETERKPIFHLPLPTVSVIINYHK